MFPVCTHSFSFRNSFYYFRVKVFVNEFVFEVVPIFVFVNENHTVLDVAMKYFHCSMSNLMKTVKLLLDSSISCKTDKIVSEMTYNVSMGTLNPTILLLPIESL